MKSLLFLISILSTSIVFAQSEKCEFPEVFIQDESSLVAVKWAKIDGKMRSDTIEYANVQGAFEVPDSVTFSNSVMTYYSSNGGEVTTKTGTYKISDKKFTWKLKDGEASYKYKSKSRGNLICVLNDEGIMGVSSNKKDSEERTTVYYTLKPK